MGYILTDTSPAYELVGDITVSSATTSVSFTGLNFTSADDLLLVSNINTPSLSVASQANLFVNGNTTSTNYYSQYISANSTSVGGLRENNANMMYLNTSASHSVISKIKMTNSGYFVTQNNGNRMYGSSLQDLLNIFTTSTFTIALITSLTITTSQTNAIGIGSRFRLYKLVAEKVADITVSTATTSVDITGLSIDKSSEYMLVSEINNTSASTSTYYNFVNANTTITNYYAQELWIGSTSVYSYRNNSPIYSVANSATKTFCYSNIKLTNNGNFVIQNNSMNRIGTSALEMQTDYGTSTFTTSLITQLTINASVTNAIGVGSRFQLYKLR